MTAQFTQNPRAATLAVGTELTDGQIVDRNSAWISARLVDLGFKVIEHRAVADDHQDIARALRELASRVDYLFVTGGLGPTSDDFTRDLLADVFQRPLEFDPGSWQHLSELLGSRGIEVREIQKKQCFFPCGSRVLTNPAGTANAFQMDVEFPPGRRLTIIALPGPPVEIAAVWALNLGRQLGALVGEEERESLMILRFLGRGESQIAEVTEEVIAGLGLRVGYRAHLPYIEVKLWHRKSQARELAQAKSEIEARLQAFLVNRDDEDVADALFTLVNQPRNVRICDRVTGGVLTERLAIRAQHLRLKLEGLLIIETHLSERASSDQQGADETLICLNADDEREIFSIESGPSGGSRSVVEVAPLFKSGVRSERGRKFLTEKFLHLLSTGSLAL